MKHLKIQFDVFYSFAIRNCQFPAVSCTSSIPELDRNPSARREVDGDWKALLDAAATDVPSGLHPQWSPRVSILSRGLVTWMILDDLGEPHFKKPPCLGPHFETTPFVLR